MLKKISARTWTIVILVILMTIVGYSQIQQSQTSSGTAVNITSVAGTAAATAAAGVLKVGIVDSTGGTVAFTGGNVPVAINSGSVTIGAGTNNIGFLQIIPTNCGGTALHTYDNVGIATGAGTNVSAATGCIVNAYVNNTTNNYVTLRLSDRQGTPVIWLGGNADYSLPPNQATPLIGLQGITFTSGINAIASASGSLNLHIVTRE